MLSQSFQYLTNTRMTYFTCGKDPASRARPVYRKTKNPSRFIERKQSTENDKSKKKNGSLEGPYNSTLSRGRSKTLKKVIRQLKPIQVWDWLFRSCELNGRILLHNGLINTADIEACFLRGDCKNLSIKLPAYCILQCLLRSAKSDSPGLLISDDVELTKFNWPEDKVFEWFFGPLVTMKEQIRGLQLDENEEAWVSKLFMCHNNDRPEDWNGSGFPSDDRVRRAQLQAIFRRLQGIVASMSRMPTFRRRFNNLARILYVEALESGLLGHSRASASPGSNRIGSASHEVKTNVEMEEGSPNGAGLV